jgi:hypothetical protein
VGVVAFRRYNPPLLFGDKGLTLRDVLFGLDELSQTSCVDDSNDQLGIALQRLGEKENPS